jgi:NADP-dependent 3-hydroxy acid dehydrogenase YdfG
MGALARVLEQRIKLMTQRTGTAMITGSSSGIGAVYADQFGM